MVGIQLDLDCLPLHVRMSLVINLLIYYDLPIVSSNNETFVIGQDALDFEVVHRRLLDEGQVLPTVFNEHDFTMFSAENYAT